MLHRRKNVSLHRENYFSMNGGYIQYTTPLSDKDIVLCVHPMLYASPLITLTQHGYTKHYFEEGRRICSKIGGGFINVHPNEINNHVQELNHNTYEWQYQSQLNGIRYTFGHCIHSEPNVIPMESLRRMLFEQELSQDRGEPAFYYHSDHLGSTAYLVVNGHVAQVLNYLPFGEDWLESNNFNPDDTTRLGIYRFNGKEKDYESGFHYYGARYYWSEVLTGWLSVDPMMDKYPNISPYNYCMWNPVKLVDVDGLYPRAILKYDARAFPHGGGYRLTSSAVHLLSLVSGVKESYIANSIIVKRGFGHYVPWYSSKKGGGAITLGYSSNCSNIILTQNFFEDDASAYNNHGYGQNISEWLDILSHEVGHIPQIDKNGGMAGYVSNAMMEYLQSAGHDAAPSEIEADIGQTQYRKFCAFVSQKYGEESIPELFSSHISDKRKIQIIDKWWNEYKKSCNEAE